MDVASWRSPELATSGRVGAQLSSAIVVLIVVDLLIQRTIPGPVALLVVVVMGVAGLAAFRLDWERLGERPFMTWVPYLWTTSGLIGWAVYVGLSGPITAHRLVLVPAIAVVASAVGYPLRGQIAMYAVAGISLVAGYAWAGAPTLGATILLHLGLLAILVVTVVMVSQHLRNARRRAERTRQAAERRAQLLQAVASLSLLDPEAAMEEAVSALIDLGFDAATVNELEDGVLVPRAHEGFPPDRPPQRLPVGDGVAGRAMAELRTVVVTDYQAHPASLDYRPDVGSVVAVPVLDGEEPIGAVLTVRRERGEVPPLMVEVAETIAVQSGRTLANARRFEAEQRMAERLADLNQLKSQLLTNVSSELRSPLTMVRGVSETLLDRPDLLDTEPSLLSRLNVNTERLSGMIHDLLDFSRLQAGRYELKPEEVDVAALVRDAVPGNLEVVVVGAPVTLADERLLRRALHHLLHDLQGAFQAVRVLVDGGAETGEVRVQIRLRRRGELQAGGAIGISLASEILNSHGATIEVDEADRDHVSVSFSLPPASRWQATFAEAER